MSLNQIQLTNQQLSSLYANVLIETQGATSVPEFQPLTSEVQPTKTEIQPLKTENQPLKTENQLLKTEYQPLKHLGKNAKHIILLVNYEEVPFLPDQELTFLTNILAACKLSLADVAIVNLFSLNGQQVEPAIQHLEPRQVILFGMEPLSIGLPINFPQFQLQPFNKRIYLYSPSLQELERNKELKLRLWSGLKTMFDL